MPFGIKANREKRYPPPLTSRFPTALLEFVEIGIARSVNLIMYVLQYRLSSRYPGKNEVEIQLMQLSKRCRTEGFLPRRAFELFDLLRQGFLGTLKTSAAIRVMRSAKPRRFGSACSRGSARREKEV